MPGAYGDRRRNTWAAIFEQSPRPSVWLLPTENGKPEVTRRTVGLRRYWPVSVRPDLITVEEFIRRNGFTPRSNWSGVKPTSLHVVRVRDSSGEEFDLPAMGMGTTVWVVDPNPGKNDEPAPKDLAAPRPVELTPVQIADLADEVVRLRAEVDRLKAKYETSCKGLVRHYGSSPEDWRMVPCGGFLGHPGACAEVW